MENIELVLTYLAICFSPSCNFLKSHSYITINKHYCTDVACKEEHYHEHTLMIVFL